VNQEVVLLVLSNSVAENIRRGAAVEFEVVADF
jgi:hypothetical protein